MYARLRSRPHCTAHSASHKGLQTRPFSDAEEAIAPLAVIGDRPSLQTRLESASLFGPDLQNIPVFPGCSPPIQRNPTTVSSKGEISQTGKHLSELGDRNGSDQSMDPVPQPILRLSAPLGQVTEHALTYARSATLPLLPRAGIAPTTVTAPRIQRWSPSNTTSETATPTAPPWNRTEIMAIQRQLRRLGLYQIRVDGVLGPMTESGLVEAFGGEQWRTLDAATATGRLMAATAPTTGRRGEHHLRYGEMFRDGVLDMTLGIGFDEEGHHRHTIRAFQRILTARGFVQDADAARQIYKQAGRAMGESAFGLFFVRENALTYTPPAAEARQVHAVVRLIFSADGSEGAAASGAFREGMAQSDIAYYSGHGRYGSGPDFDRNFMSFELLDRDGNIEQEIRDYTVLEREMRNEGRRSGRSAWQQFLWRVNHNRINVLGSNQGNVFVNPQNRHSGEFGSRLIYWSLQRQGRTGSAPVTGQAGELARAAVDHPERRYRLLVFDGCRTQDYVTSLRATPGHDSRSTDILATQRTVDWGDETGTLETFLDSVLGQQSAEQIIRGMDAQQGPTTPGGRRGGAYRGFGLEDNPVVR